MLIREEGALLLDSFRGVPGILRPVCYVYRDPAVRQHRVGADSLITGLGATGREPFRNPVLKPTEWTVVVSDATAEQCSG